MKSSDKKEITENHEKDNGLPIVFGLGGLSESGKSVAGIFLQERLGVKRLKIRAIIGSMINSSDVNETDAYTEKHTKDTVFWQTLTSFLIEYLRKNEIKACALESFRKEGLVRALKKRLGQKFVFIYIESPETVRARRQQNKFASFDESLADIKKRDEEKIAHGAVTIKTMADFVISNDRSEENFLEDISNLTRNILRKNSPAVS